MTEHGRGVFVRARPVVRRVASDRFARRHREEGQAAFIAEAERSRSSRASTSSRSVSEAAADLTSASSCA